MRATDACRENRAVISRFLLLEKKKERKEKKKVPLFDSFCFHLPLIFLFYLLASLHSSKSWRKFIFDFKNTFSLHVLPIISDFLSDVAGSRPSRMILISMRAGTDTESC